MVNMKLLVVVTPPSIYHFLSWRILVSLVESGTVLSNLWWILTNAWNISYTVVLNKIELLWLDLLLYLLIILKPLLLSIILRLGLVFRLLVMKLMNKGGRRGAAFFLLVCYWFLESYKKLVKRTNKRGTVYSGANKVWYITRYQ